MDSYATANDDGIPLEAPPPPRVFAAHYPGITPGMVIAEIERAAEIFPQTDAALARARDVWAEYKGYHRLARVRRPVAEQARAWQQDRDMVLVRARQVRDFPEEYRPRLVMLWQALEGEL